MACPHRKAIQHPAPMIRPDAILFNGGFFAPAVTREKIVDAVVGWFSGSNAWRPKILSNQAPESAVAIGAAYYGRVRRGGGLRIRAGSARTYYIGVQSEGAQDRAPQAVCVLPSGIEEGTTLPLPNREFAVLTNRPVSFTLYSSTTRHDAHGEVAVLDARPDPPPRAAGHPVALWKEVAPDRIRRAAHRQLHGGGNSRSSGASRLRPSTAGACSSSCAATKPNLQRLPRRPRRRLHPSPPRRWRPRRN